MNIEDVWRLHRQWSAVASRTAGELRRWRSVNLTLILSAALLGALAAQRSWLPQPVPLVLGIVGAVALAVAGVVQARLLTEDKVRSRIGTRAASEGLKGLVYQHLAGVGVSSGADGDSRLRDKVDEVCGLARDHAALVVGSAPDNAPLPKVTGVADYLRERAQGQRTWHKDATGRHRRLARRWRMAELVATVGAAVLAALAGALDTSALAPWVGVATTAGTAFAAHLAGEQHDRIAGAYARTVLDLDALLREFDLAVASADRAAQFVADVETVLAAQNGSWVSLFTAK